MLSLLAAVALQAQPFEFAVKPDKGLSISVAGVPVVQGSWVQYYEPDWSKAYFTSANSTQSVKTLDNGDTVLTFKSQDGKAYGSETFTPVSNGVKVTYAFGWTGDKPVDVELTAAALWADSLMHGSLTVDDKATRSLMPMLYPSDEIKDRLYAAHGKEFIFHSPAGKLTFMGGSPDWTCFDARTLNKLWAKNRDLIWLGQQTLQVKPNEMTTASAEWHFDAAPPEVVRGGTATLSASVLPNALTPAQDDLPLLPTPRESLMKKDQAMPIGSFLDCDPPGEAPNLPQELLSEIQARWIVPDLKTKETNSARFFMRVQNLGLPSGGYELRISPTTALIMGQDLDGLHNAVETLSQLFFARDGRLWLQTGVIRDWPAVAWRGVHLFVGPHALEFHQRLWKNVLLPLKFNKVVLECERTKWDAFPDPKPAGYMSKDDLLQLFEFYRANDVEPIPLIQSFGHMGWLFLDKQNLDLAMYPNSPDSIDPRSKKAEDLLSSIWDEAIGLLHPRTIHFGLDEVNMRWPTRDMALTTQLWQMQLPFLGAIAAKHNCQMMCWGDQCLAPGQAPDAALADTAENAAARRSYIPRGALIGDWHYKDDPDPNDYLKDLQLWKSEGLVPIASTWFRPENIEGFYQAAIQQGCGTLQTTWAGYNSDEPNMIREFRQFAAMVVAADYAWSGRKTDWDKLGYDAAEAFSKMYFREPSKLTPTAGESAGGGSGAEGKIGDVTFKFFEPYSLRSLLTPQNAQLPQDMVVQTPGLKGADLCLALDTTTAIEDKQPVADLEVFTSNGTIKKTLSYGVDVRSTTDAKACVVSPRADTLAVVRIKLGQQPVEIQKIVFHGTSAYAGLRLHGITAF